MPFGSWRSAALACALGYAIGYLAAALAIRPVTSGVPVVAAAAGLLVALPTGTVLGWLCRAVYQRPILDRLDERTFAGQNRRAARTRALLTVTGGGVAAWGLTVDLEPPLNLLPPAAMGLVLAAAGWYLSRVYQPR